MCEIVIHRDINGEGTQPKQRKCAIAQSLNQSIASHCIDWTDDSQHLERYIYIYISCTCMTFFYVNVLTQIDINAIHVATAVQCTVEYYIM